LRQRGAKKFSGGIGCESGGREVRHGRARKRVIRDVTEVVVEIVYES